MGSGASCDPDAVEIADVDWFFHRIAASESYSSGLHEIREEWNFEDVLQAHDVLDAMELAQRKQNARHSKK